ncbi:VWA domain-containing protein [Desulfobacula sp.]|uniref:vWA domain-containing protein n=1 Tax=Desulfobacula sp. TaxID=2593537 RepID=UPI002616BB32|nr:VWA domain-containing protein [Desulfobacula sp.]
MTRSTSYYQRIGTFFSIGIIFALTAGTAGAQIEHNKVICRVETDRAVLLAGDAQNIVLKITLDAPTPPLHRKRPPVNLALVLDQSGSMKGFKIEQAKAAAIEALARLGEQDVFSVVVYDTNVHTIVPAQNARDIQGIIHTLQQIRANGSTALFGGVSQGASEIRKFLENDYVHRIVLLSDGLANIGPRMPEDLGRLGAALMKENISVTTVGVGTRYKDRELLEEADELEAQADKIEDQCRASQIQKKRTGNVCSRPPEAYHHCPWRGVSI